MRYCPKCGDEIQPTDKYCMACGVELAEYGVGGATQPDDSSQRSRRGRQRRGPTQGQRQREPTPQQRSEKQGWGRRGFLALGTAGVAGVGVFGWIGLQKISDGPGEPAGDFVEALGRGDLSEANDLIHSDARINGAGTAGDVLSASVGVDAVFEVADVSVVDTNVIEKANNLARVAVTVNIDVGIDETEGNIVLVMRQDNSDWRVWNIQG